MPTLTKRRSKSKKYPKALVRPKTITISRSKFDPIGLLCDSNGFLNGVGVYAKAAGVSRAKMVKSCAASASGLYTTTRIRVPGLLQRDRSDTQLANNLFYAQDIDGLKAVLEAAGIKVRIRD